MLVTAISFDQYCLSAQIKHIYLFDLGVHQPIAVLSFLTLLSSAGRAQDCNCSTSNRYLEARGSIPRGETFFCHSYMNVTSQYRCCGWKGQIHIFGLKVDFLLSLRQNDLLTLWSKLCRAQIIAGKRCKACGTLTVLWCAAESRILDHFVQMLPKSDSTFVQRD